MGWPDDQIDDSMKKRGGRTTDAPRLPLLREEAANGGDAAAEVLRDICRSHAALEVHVPGDLLLIGSHAGGVRRRRHTWRKATARAGAQEGR